MLFAARGSEGIYVYNYTNGAAESVLFKERQDKSAYCRVLKFSPDGNHLAYCDGHQVAVLSVKQGLQQAWTADLPRTTDLQFSGDSTYLCTYEQFAVRQGPGGENVSTNNVTIFNTATGEVAMSYAERRNDWKPRWSSDAHIMSKMSGSEIHFYEPPNFDRFVKKLVIKGITNYATSEASDPHNVAVYVPAVKNGPCFVRIFQYPHFAGPESALCHTSFFRADRASLKFNPRGDACLALTTADVDKSGASYYGEQTLYLLLTNTETLRMDLPKPGPIYSSEFSPLSKEFCVVYGYMPAKATVYNLKGDPVFDFGTAPRNEVHYNVFGDILVLAGFGNLRGTVEFWSTKDWKLAQKVSAEDTTVFHWGPDGQHLLTATTAPRLRVGNGFRVWHYTGKVGFRKEFPEGVELLDVAWCSQPAKNFTQPPVKFVPAAQHNVSIGTGSGEKSAVPALAAYVPPHLRGQGRSAGPIRTLEPAQNANKPEELSKAALKNKKKREAKKKAAAADQNPEPVANGTSPASSGAHASPQKTAAAGATGMDDKEKKIRNLTKKLEGIELLKKNQREGKTLEINQLEKLKREAELRRELDDLLD